MSNNKRFHYFYIRVLLAKDLFQTGQRQRVKFNRLGFAVNSIRDFLFIGHFRRQSTLEIRVAIKLANWRRHTFSSATKRG
jgi:hypothetical protein